MERGGDREGAEGNGVLSRAGVDGFDGTHGFGR